MVGRKTRRNCPFCMHPERDGYEERIRTGVLDVVDLDANKIWAEGTAHRHMRRHSGEYHNNSNSQCPLCTHPERANIEEAVMNGLVSAADMALDLEMTSSNVEHHIEMHTAPIIQRQVEMEVLPAALSSVRGAMIQTENNLQRLNSLFNSHVSMLEEERNDEGILDYRGLDTAVKMHREIRDTLTDIAEYIEKAESIGSNEQVSVLTVIQAHFSEKSPDEWRVMRKALADAGVLEDG